MPDVVRTVGRCSIVSELGRGGMAVVYLARQLDLDRLVALKELAAFHAADPSFAQLPPAAEVAGVDPDISAWIERMTAKERAGRPESTTVAWEELDEILIGKLGPRWRREARLGDPPRPLPGPATPPPSVPMGTPAGIDMQGIGPDAPQPMPTADAPVTDDAEYETYHAPPSGPAPEPEPAVEPPPTPPPPAPEPVPALPSTPPPPPPEPVAPPTPLRPRTPEPPPPAPLPPAAETIVPPPAGEPAPPNVAGPARLGAAALLAGLLIPLFAESPDRWNAFAVLSPFEVLGVALAGLLMLAAGTWAYRTSSSRWP